MQAKHNVETNLHCPTLSLEEKTNPFLEKPYEALKIKLAQNMKSANNSIASFSQ